MRTRRRTALAAVAALSVTLVASGLSTAPASASPYCGITWGSLMKSDTRMTPAPIVNARIGQQTCYDRLVIDVSGTPAPGYFVRYTDGFHQPGSGNPMAVAGGAVITITALAPGYDANYDSTVPWPTGAHIATPTTFSTFRDLVYGGSFEGESAFGLGVRARLPFRVFTLAGPGSGTRLVIDVAHRW